MRMHIQILRNVPALTEALKRAGWAVTPQPDRCLIASNPSIRDEEEARLSLWELGLLISGRVRVQFHWPEQESANKGRRELVLLS